MLMRHGAQGVAGDVETQGRTCLDILWGGRRREEGGPLTPTTRVKPLCLWASEPHPFSFCVHSLGTSSFPFNGTFCKSVLLTLLISILRGKEPCTGDSLFKVTQQVRGGAWIFNRDIWGPESGSSPWCCPHRRLWDGRDGSARVPRKPSWRRRCLSRVLKDPVFHGVSSVPVALASRLGLGKAGREGQREGRWAGQPQGCPWSVT